LRDTVFLGWRYPIPLTQPIEKYADFQAEYVGETHLRVTAIARGIDCESNPIRLNIDWDGKWDFGDDAMTEHFAISEIHGDGIAAVQGDGRGSRIR
jgi:hypothetical protein